MFRCSGKIGVHLAADIPGKDKYIRRPSYRKSSSICYEQTPLKAIKEVHRRSQTHQWYHSHGTKRKSKTNKDIQIITGTGERDIYILTGTR